MVCVFLFKVIYYGKNPLNNFLVGGFNPSEKY